MSISFRCYKSTSPTVKGDLMWDTGTDGLGIVSGKMTQRLCAPGDMTFTLHATHPGISSVGPDDICKFLNVYRVINKKESLVFRCFVTSVEFDFYGNASYTCIDVFKLLDSTTLISTVHDTGVKTIIASVISNYNNVCSPNFNYYCKNRSDSSTSSWLVYKADGTNIFNDSGNILETLKTLDGQNGAIKVWHNNAYIYDTHVKSFVNTTYARYASQDPQSYLYLIVDITQDSTMSSIANSQHIIKGYNVASYSLSYEYPEHNSILANDTEDSSTSKYTFTGDFGKKNLVCTSDAINSGTYRTITVRYTSATSAEELESMAREDILSSGYAITKNISVEAFDMAYADDSVSPFDITNPVCIEGETEDDNIYTFMDEYVVDFVTPSSSRISVNISPRITR